MTAKQREVFIDVDPDVRIRYIRSQAPPPVAYAITLEVREDGGWATIRLWDNADDPDQHHEHAYTRRGGKQPPVIHDFASINEAMAAAIGRARLNAHTFVRRCKEES